MSVRRYKAHPQSASGDFYVVHNECVTCGASHVAAPDLIGWVDGDTSHCIWKKQPETAGEIEQAMDVFAASCVGCHRYAGDDPEIIKRIGWDYCDAPQPYRGTMRAWNNDTVAVPAFGLIPGKSPVWGKIWLALESLYASFIASLK